MNVPSIFFSFLIGAALWVGSASTADAKWLPLEAKLVNPPKGYVGYCSNYYRLDPACAKGFYLGSGTLVFSNHLMAVMEEVQLAGNRAFRGRADKGEEWTLQDISAPGAQVVGDCDDVMIAKMYALMQLGVPRAGMRVAIVHVPRVGWHGVVVVRTSEGDFILDNLQKNVARYNNWQFRDYRWMALETPGSGKFQLVSG